jgi:protein-S-isoprenylcysteine O-methyltransferase Ste14
VLLSPIVVTYPLALVVIIIDILSRDKTNLGGRAKRNEDADRGSTIFMAVAFIACLILIPFLISIPFGRIQFTLILGWGIGPSLMVCGIVIRIWARSTLGRYYSRTLRTASDQNLVDWGAYRLIRHPGYAGYLLMWFGLAISSINWLVILVVVPLIISAYIHRIGSEEQMLLKAIGSSYSDYRSRTKKLIPFVY